MKIFPPGYLSRWLYLWGPDRPCVYSRRLASSRIPLEVVGFDPGTLRCSWRLHVPEIYDAIVVGAGPGGSALAADLASRGVKVLLLDKSRFPRDKACGDALSPRAVRVLHRLGVDDLLREVGYSIEGASLTAPNGLTIEAELRGADHDRTGYVVRRIDLDERICDHAVQSGAELVDRTRVSEVGDGGSEPPYVVGMRGGKRHRWQARLVVLAVGANLTLLDRMGLLPKRQKLSFAMRAYWRGTKPLGDRIQLRFDGVPLPGYGWIFPVSESEANVGVCIFNRSPGSGSALPSLLESFVGQPAVDDLLGSGQMDGPPKGFPIRTDFHRSPARRGRVLLIGEAAGLVNPFTGEGVDYALESAMLASKTIRKCLEHGDFSDRALSHYERDLRQEFQRMFVVTSFIRRFYMNERMLNALARACKRWPEVPRVFVDVLLTRTDPLQVFSPRIVARVGRSLLNIGLGYQRVEVSG